MSKCVFQCQVNQHWRVVFQYETTMQSMRHAMVRESKKRGENHAGGCCRESTSGRMSPRKQRRPSDLKPSHALPLFTINDHYLCHVHSVTAIPHHPIPQKIKLVLPEPCPRAPQWHQRLPSRRHRKVRGSYCAVFVSVLDIQMGI